ncbi:gamma-glutamyltransferase [Patulibacter defluvii]|uniref:gamma-glutamyltransferase n=1 Tax=Patulibacter defluvii TaxID=3095358 RepID=UPI002A760F28|nr:gamma-glutamyltransferase [Patulibacter sp. DM4]
MGIVAAGHPRTAEVGATVLREGGSAADAAVAAVLASWVCEPLLTGPAAGGHLLAVDPDGTPMAIDAFCAVPGAGGRRADAAPLRAVDVDFGGARQVFHVGAASVGAFGLIDGLVRLHDRYGRMPLEQLAAPAVRMAEEGVALNRQQAYVAAILEGILRSTPEVRALWAPDGALLAEGERFRCPELGETIARLGREGAAPLRDGDLAAACVAWCREQGGALTAADQAGYRAVERPPVRVDYRDRTVLTTPPPSAGGLLLALALGRLDRGSPGPPTAAALVAAMAEAEDERTAAFVDGLAEPGFADRLLALRLGSTTHLSAIDDDGLSCAVTCTNGEGSGLVVPGTGIHLNNVMGEEDLNPQLGPAGAGMAPFASGRRLPSMMAPTAVIGPGGLEAILGSAGSIRIRSALLQVIVGLVDHGRPPGAAVEAPRVHLEEGVVYREPGVVGADGDWSGGRPVVEFREPNLFFGGVQIACRNPADGRLSAAADPRRGGAVAVA